jgi:hypothetical protein
MLRLVQKQTTARYLLSDQTELAAEWLLDSGICRPGFGVAEQYRINLTQYAPVSNRATAHYVSTLLWLFESCGETRHIDRALTVAQYLSRAAKEGNTLAFPGESLTGRRSTEDRLDETSVMVRALLRSWEASHHAEFLMRAIECAKSMQRMPGRCLPRPALVWLELADLTGNPQWRELYDSSLAWNLTFYPDFLGLRGRKAAAAAASETHLESELISGCRFLEELLPALASPRSRPSSAVSVFEKTFSLMGQWLHAPAQGTMSSEACARVLRLRLYAAGLGLMKLDVERVEREAALLGDMQADHHDRRVEGGFYAGQLSNTTEPVVGLTATALCMQALAQWRKFQGGDFRPDLRQMI